MISSSCHCGRVRLTVLEPPPLLNECHCSVCYKYGAIWGYYSLDDVTITIDGKDTPATDPAFSSTTPLSGLDLYVRDVEAEKSKDSSPGETARGYLAFARCAHCGCMTHWVNVRPREITGEEHGLGINTRLMDQKDLDGVKRRVSEGPL
ncbi:MAG: hypothetical protein STHCBS139747_006570 [Sporothrix thermara]